jgi:hypothetical protein
MRRPYEAAGTLANAARSVLNMAFTSGNPA